MNNREEFIILWKQTLDKFGLHKTNQLISYIAETLPKKKYRTTKSLHNHIRREVNSFYKLREDLKYAQQYEEKYGRWNLK